jgi:Na+/glutamate symporter
MPYCPRCGKEVKEDDIYCPQCQAPLKAGGPVYRRHDEKNEKQEKDEKEEKGEKSEKSEKGEHEDKALGALTGGLILLWLGVSFLIRDYGYITWVNWWPYFVLGVGAILILRGLMAYVRTSSWRAAVGYIIGGAIIALFGAGEMYGIRNWWAVIIVITGVYVILSGFTQRGKSPRP